MSKTFVIGDIHGSYRALLQCLKNSSFDYTEDTLICLGDVSDGWPETKQSIEELLKVKNLIYILGNHDFWTLDWMETGYADDIWLTQGGKSTVESYDNQIPQSHIDMLRSAKPNYTLDNKLFVHAGINSEKGLDEQTIQTFLWDRSFVRVAKTMHMENSNNKLTKFDEVFVGHTPIEEPKPVQYCEVWMMDTGAGWSGCLSMMNINTHEVFVSEAVPNLYPGITGRKRF